LKWHKPPPALQLRWMGRAFETYAAGAAASPRPLAAIIGPAGPKGEPGIAASESEIQAAVTEALNNFTLENPDDILDFIDNLDRSLT
jgi:hypothetical protein